MLIFHTIAEIVNNALIALGKLFEKQNTDKQQLGEADVLKTKKRLEKAVNICEEIIDNTENFFNWFVRSFFRTKEQSKQFRQFVAKHTALKKKFNKND